MQFGKSIVGAIIGAVLGVGLLILINALTTWDYYWLAIPVALLTGLGVRWVADTHGHPSYVRGVLTGVIGILAFMLGQYAIAKVATLRGNAKPIVAQMDDVRAADAAEADTADEAVDENENAADAADADAVADTDQPAQQEAPAEPGAGDVEQPALLPDAARPLRVQQWTTVDLVSLCVAALVGYLLGRGSDSAAARTHDDDVPSAPNPAMPPSD
jgi:hypothetical protein